MTAADHTPSPATDGLREAIEALAADFRSEIDWSNGRSNYGDNEAWEQAARRVDDILAAHPATPSETATEGRTFTADEVIEIANETSDSFGNLYRLDFIDRIRHEAAEETQP